MLITVADSFSKAHVSMSWFLKFPDVLLHRLICTYACEHVHILHACVSQFSILSFKSQRHVSLFASFLLLLFSQFFSALICFVFILNSLTAKILFGCLSIARFEFREVLCIVHNDIINVYCICHLASDTSKLFVVCH